MTIPLVALFALAIAWMVSMPPYGIELNRVLSKISATVAASNPVRYINDGRPVLRLPGAPRRR